MGIRRRAGVGPFIALLVTGLAGAEGLEAQRGVDGWWGPVSPGAPLGIDGWRVEARVVIGGDDRYQGRDRRDDRRDRRHRDRDDWDDDDWDDDDRRRGWKEPAWEVVVVREEGRDRGRGRAVPRRGPDFCSRGGGHPVHGWRWCDDRGYVRAPVWRSVNPGRLYFRRSARDSGVFGARELARILGEDAVEDLYRSARWMGAREPLQGRWMPTRDRWVRILQVRTGNIPLAEFRDLDGDRRVDVLLVAGF
jgi:hypothetical protein